jgi:hypothetical protein
VGRFAALLLRLIVIGFGFFLAALSAGIAWIFLTRLVVPEDFGQIGELELTVTLIVGTIGVSAVLARAAAIPAFLLIAVFEFTRRRDWLSHALAGAALAIVTNAASLAAGTPMPAGGIAAALACGMIAALVYWLVAGRTAGAWLPSARESAAIRGN